MSVWQETLEHFRILGGVIDNVELREGVNGRGIFCKDARQPVRLFTPNKLLLPTAWLQLDMQGNLILSDDCDWDDGLKSFYLSYLSNYGFTETMMQDMLQQQSQLCALPDKVKSMMSGFGFAQDLFQKPSRSACLEMYKQSRRVFVSNQLVLMPLIELMNHEECSKKSFHIDHQGVSVSGRFKDEISVHYGMVGDAALMYEHYGFSTRKPYAFSGALVINLGASVIKIARFLNLFTTVGKANLPKVHMDGNEVHLSCLLLGSINDRGAPKNVFRKLMQSVGMQANQADKIFDGIVDQNQSFFLHLLEELKPLNGAVVEHLRVMAKNQLIPLGVSINL